ncbi:MAG: hypothetical protein FWE94_08525 [Coriobacteriia bacterium]|nr:hypothetical protein [Coriobacteriia bacterium]
MDQGVSQVRVEDVEAAISQIGEIKAARVVADSDGAIQEVHILALPTKQPKQLVRDIESTLMARFALPVDHRKISIAQLGRELIEAEGQAERGARGESRARIVSINSTASGVISSAVVTLEVSGVEYIGRATGTASESGRMRQVAAAALDALTQQISDCSAFALEDAMIIQLGGKRVAAACVSLVTRDGEQSFTGSALVRNNDDDSIVRAILNAVNRRMGLLTTK